VPHISHYQLTIEENTYFHKHTPALPEPDQIWEMQTLCQTLLAENHYQQYEISAYSKTGKQCLHNLNYWQFGDYIGIGAGAHGKISEKNKDTGDIKIIRRWKHRQPQQYIKQALDNEAASGQQVLGQQDIVFEYLLNVLRLKTGADINTFENNTGLKYPALKQAVSHIDSQLLVLNKNKITTTDKGFLFLNEILENLV
jgi:oxygen-independent coproporphyrinogen-3 oxidase